MCTTKYSWPMNYHRLIIDRWLGLLWINPVINTVQTQLLLFLHDRYLKTLYFLEEIKKLKIKSSEQDKSLNWKNDSNWIQSVRLGSLMHSISVVDHGQERKTRKKSYRYSRMIRHIQRDLLKKNEHHIIHRTHCRLLWSIRLIHFVIILLILAGMMIWF